MLHLVGFLQHGITMHGTTNIKKKIVLEPQQRLIYVSPFRCVCQIYID